MTDTPRRIQILDTTLANQIAAGEVIERPASVLKELLENSLDAGASKIRVAIEQGGSGLIEVRDDGSGISVDDLKLALQRHATSKISNLEELENIQSLGFRGEALPSIASVSRLTLESRLEDADTGWQLRCEGGQFNAAAAPVAHPVGTTVSVRDLFFNTPARRKFLRTRRTEQQQIETLFKRMALVSFGVHLELIHDGRSVLRLPRALNSAARQQRLTRLLGKSFTDQSIEVISEAEGLRLWGWLASPTSSRDRNDMQYLYINNRAVSDSVCRHAVRMAFEDTLEYGQHPAWVLYLDIDPGQVDVNVHPAKQEVRFHEARMVHDFIRSAVRSVLSPELTIDPVHSSQNYPLASASRGFGPGGLAETPGSFQGSPVVQSPRRPMADVPSAPSELGLAGVALLEQRWWLGRRNEDWVVADLQIVAELLCRDALQHLLTEQQPQSRPLLLPAGLALSPNQVPHLEAALEPLAALGLELRISGPDRGMLLAVPLAMARIPGEVLAQMLAEGLEEGFDSSKAEAWIPYLAQCAGQHPGADLKQSGQMLEHLMQLHESSPRGAWRKLGAEDLSKWLQEPG